MRPHVEAEQNNCDCRATEGRGGIASTVQKMSL